MGVTSQESVNIFALSTVPQSNYQTDLTATSTPKNFRQIEKKDRQFASFTQSRSNNKGYSTGSAYATRTEKEQDDVNFSLVEDASAQLLGERALAAFGSVETTEIVANQVYKHVFKLLNPQSNPQQPVYVYVEKAGESASRPNAKSTRYPSCVAESLMVKGQGTAKLEMTTNWNGSGKRVKPAGVNFFTSSHVKLLESLTQNFFRNAGGIFKLYPEVNLGGTSFDLNCSFRALDFSINQGLLKQAGYDGCGLLQTPTDPESAFIKGSCEIGDQSVGFNFTMLMDDDYDPQDKLQEMASISAELKYTGKTITGVHKHYALFKLLAGNISGAEPTSIDGKNGWRITTEPLAQGQILPVELEIVNNVKSYTVAADTW